MKIRKEITQDLGVAFNESSILDANYLSEKNELLIQFQVLSLAETESSKDITNITLCLSNIGRLSASLRKGYWNEYSAPIEQFEIIQLSETVKSFGGQSIYGWDFFNCEDPEYPKWSDKLSLDFTNINGSCENMISLFQEGSTGKRHLDLWVWFEDFSILDSLNNLIPTEIFIQNGKRWWEAFYRGDPRTKNQGLIPGGK